MDKQVFISLYLDTRRPKKDDTYPVRLRVFTPDPRIQKLYPTTFDLTEKEFKNAYMNPKPKPEDRELKHKLQEIENKATEEANEIIPFDFPEFENKLYRKRGEGQNVIFKYHEQINKFKSLNQIGTAQTYELSLKSLMEFASLTESKALDNLNFKTITPFWLEKFEKYMIDTKKRSSTTVSIYLRCLRAIFNNAIADKEIEPESYPFGKRKYTIPGYKKVKKALDKSKLKALFEAVPKTPEQEKAKDFWFLSYFCYGINIKDLALLKFKNFKEDTISFIRAKTKTTSKSNLKEIKIRVNQMAKNTLLKYANKSGNSNSYIFPIVLDHDSEIQKFNKIKNFTRFINQNLKKLAIDNGITEDISTYWARHSFANKAINSGKNMEFVGDAFGHGDIKTTQNYFAGFDDETKKEFSDQLMNFE
jgi:site-specific recombinase XerD